MSLTSKQLAFVFAVGEGATASAAARSAGYAHGSSQSLRVQASRLSNDPQIQRAIFDHRQRRLQGTMASKALACLEGVVDDTAAPPAARIQAAKWILEAAGHGVAAQSLQLRGGLTSADKPMSEWSLAELEEMVRKSERELADIKYDSCPVIEVSADDTTLHPSGQVSEG